MLNVDPAITPSPSIPLPRGEREAKPLSLDGREVGERVFAKYSPYLIAGSIKSVQGIFLLQVLKRCFLFELFLCFTTAEEIQND
jgi:hypothetical protein